MWKMLQCSFFVSIRAFETELKMTLQFICSCNVTVSVTSLRFSSPSKTTFSQVLRNRLTEHDEPYSHHTTYIRQSGFRSIEICWVSKHFRNCGEPTAPCLEGHSRSVFGGPSQMKRNKKALEQGCGEDQQQQGKQNKE